MYEARLFYTLDIRRPIYARPKVLAPTVEKLLPTSKIGGQTLVSGKVNLILCNFLTRISIWSWEGKQRVFNDLLRTRLSCRRMIWLLAHLPAPISRLQVVSLSQSSYVSPVELTNGRGGRSEGGAKSYDHEKAWSSIYYPILSGKNVHHSFLDLTIFAVLNFVYTVLCVQSGQHNMITRFSAKSVN
jgi:hypothetical protein